jgi:Hint module/Pregnancy-associated plasma protein-A
LGLQYVINETLFNDLASTSLTTGRNTWANAAAAGKTYRRGGYGTLNVYFGNNKGTDSAGAPPTMQYLGRVPPINDGIFMDIKTTPGGASICCHLGKSLIHEAGHWLGLLHTFAGYSCDESNMNDYVSDTPQQLSYTDNDCPVNADTCTGLPGLDPIHNYMDYSSDECVSEFTPGQIERMYIMWSLFRQNDETCVDDHVLFKFVINFDSDAKQISWTLVGNAINTGNAALLLSNQKIDNSRTQVHDICLPKNGDYTFTIYDSVGNGLQGTPPGSYKLYLGDSLLKEGSDFTFSEATSFTTSITTAPSMAPFMSSAPSRSLAPYKPPTPGVVIFPRNFCFSGETTVQVEGKGTIRMSELAIGDKVLVREGMYETVYSFGHRHESIEAEYLQLFPSNLEISMDHMVKIGSQYISASAVEVGDELETANGDKMTVEQVSYVLRKGVYAPFTMSGTIVVSNIKASSYVAFQDAQYLRMGTWSTPLSFQWLAHLSQAPHRLWTRLFGLGEGMYTSQGMSKWIHVPHQTWEWYLGQNAVVMAMLLVPAITFLLSVSAVDYFISIFVS